ncbi:MAG: FtsX-like permease family protein [Ilumatobacteraceae bacterium]
MQNANRPDAAVADDVVQALVVRGSGDLATAIDAATSGATSTLTVDEAVLALPGVEQQTSTFNQIIYSTLVVVLAVVGLFFSLLTLERLGLYGVLKAVGASSGRLFVGVVLQAVVVTIIAFVAGSALALAASGAAVRCALAVEPSRFVFTFVALLVASVLGSATSSAQGPPRDPAAAIGTSS